MYVLIELVYSLEIKVMKIKAEIDVWGNTLHGETGGFAFRIQGKAGKGIAFHIPVVPFYGESIRFIEEHRAEEFW